MDDQDEALHAEWLDPDELIDDDDEPPRRSDVRALRPRAPMSEGEAAVDGPKPAAGPPAGARLAPRRSAIPPRRGASPAETFAALSRLLLFFMLGLGLGSIFALGVATALGVRDDAPAPFVHESGRSVEATSAAPDPAIGDPGPAL